MVAPSLKGLMREIEILTHHLTFYVSNFLFTDDRTILYDSL